MVLMKNIVLMMTNDVCHNNDDNYCFIDHASYSKSDSIDDGDDNDDVSEIFIDVYSVCDVVCDGVSHGTCVGDRNGI
jgi:hypothetical protein